MTKDDHRMALWCAVYVAQMNKLSLTPPSKVATKAVRDFDKEFPESLAIRKEDIPTTVSTPVKTPRKAKPAAEDLNATWIVGNTGR